MKKYLLSLFLLGCIFTQRALSQNTEFWFAVPHSSEYPVNGLPLNVPAFLLIYNPTVQTANVVITFENGGANRITVERSIAPGGVYKHDFPTLAAMHQIENPRSQAGNVTTYGMHITSDARVAAYYMASHTDSRDIFALKGDQALGMKFYIPMQSDNYFPSTQPYVSDSGDQIDIVATEDGTVVEVTPTVKIRIGTAGSSAAGVPITRTLNKGQTLKIFEFTPNSGSLAGTLVTSTKPVAVTVLEDIIGGGDIAGDQIVPVSTVGTEYILAKTYQTAGNVAERSYLVGTEDGTNITIYTGGTNITMTLNAGEAKVYHFGMAGTPSTASAVYIKADKPIYCYQVGGESEQGVAVLPSIYSIAQKKVSYYQVQADNEFGVLVFRTGQGNNFKITYNGVTSALAIGTPINVPGMSDWQCARFRLPTAANDKVVVIENTESAFTLGYIAANTSRLSTCYGYLSSFGDFKFPNDITYKCTNASITLDAGYAKSYYWTLPDGTHPTTPTITVAPTAIGEYTVVLDQDPRQITATTMVMNYPEIIQTAPTSVSICSGTTNTFNMAAPTGGSEPYTYKWEQSVNNASWSNASGIYTTQTYTTQALVSDMYYRRIVTDACGTTHTSVSAKVIVTTTPVQTSPSPAAICSGDTYTISPGDATGGSGSYIYQWEQSANGSTWSPVAGGNSSLFTIGNGTSGSYNFPINTNYRYSYTQQIFDASELTGLSVNNLITSLAFQYIYSTAQTKNPVTIYVGNTTKLSFSSISDWIPVSDMQQVFSGTITFNNSGSNFWVDIPFTNSFQYTGKNIVIAVLSNTGSYTTGNNATFYTHVAAGSKSIQRFVDGTTPIDAGSLATASSISTIRNNVRFNVTVGGGAGSSYTTPQLTSNMYYRRKVTDAICGGSPITSTSALISMSMAVTPSISILGNTTPCSGVSVSFTATPTNGGTLPNYQWKKNGLDISGATLSTYTYMPVNGDVITCVLTSNAGCVSSSTATSNSLTMNINTSCGGTVSASCETVCEGAGSITLTLGAYTGTVTKWQYTHSPFSTWVDINETTENLVVENLPQTARFRAVVNGSSYSDPITITTQPKPTVSITGATAICAGSTSQLSPTTGGTWVSNNTAVATVTNAGVVTGVSTGSVTFTYTRDGGCSASITP